MGNPGHAVKAAAKVRYRELVFLRKCNDFLSFCSRSCTDSYSKLIQSRYDQLYQHSLTICASKMGYAVFNRGSYQMIPRLGVKQPAKIYFLSILQTYLSPNCLLVLCQQFLKVFPRQTATRIVVSKHSGFNIHSTVVLSSVKSCLRSMCQTTFVSHFSERIWKSRDTESTAHHRITVTIFHIPVVINTFLHDSPLAGAHARSYLGKAWLPLMKKEDGRQLWYKLQSWQ